MKYADIDRIYRNVPLDNLPWNSETPPDALVRLVQDGKVRPCRTIDLGCGAGNYAIYLADIGFDLTGVDSSPTAIKIAEENAKKRGARCRFIVADLLGDLHEVADTFDFAYDWEFLHHIFPEDRESYIRNVHKITNPGAMYFSVCFSENDPQFGGTGKYRTTRIGTTLYFSSESEVRELVSPYFTIRELKTIEVAGKSGSHVAVSVLAERW
ncbi:class I SAM-dependent methyltransferase [Methanoregula sp.]|jgi:SAM-dependent methyltransferase|uniref:class I SAM-dependent methyltransferase n=1 Tax=Methanoregula sp. TaxID=2052170 RepID=UPI003C2A20C6